MDAKDSKHFNKDNGRERGQEGNKEYEYPIMFNLFNDPSPTGAAETDPASASCNVYQRKDVREGVPETSRDPTQTRTQTQAPTIHMQPRGGLHIGQGEEQGRGRSHSQGQSQGQGQGQSNQGQGQSQKSQKFHNFVEKEKRLKELLLGKIQTHVNRNTAAKESSSNQSQQNIHSALQAQASQKTSNASSSAPKRQTLPPIMPLPGDKSEPKAGMPSYLGQVCREVSPSKRMRTNTKETPSQCRTPSTNTKTTAKEQDSDPKSSDPSLCSTSRWQHNPQNADAGSSLLEEVLTEKKLQLMQSPEVVRWLQEQQLLARETKLLNVPTMPIRSIPETTPPGTSVQLQHTACNQSDLHRQDSVQGEGQHQEGQGHDPDQQNRTGIWSREASAFMSVSRIRNTDVL